ncbi:MAG: DNA repair protein RecN [Bacteroidota bacterium]
MLQHLHIRNYALFAETNVRFGDGLNILTGETGAGKSLLVGALGLINGKRADNSVVFRDGEKCVVEATFGSLSPSVKSKLASYEEFDLDGNELLIRREINPSGKSRAFINDTPVALTVLREVSSLLVDMHSQHENQQLVSHDQQLLLLDAYAGTSEKVQAFGQKLKSCEQLWQEIRSLKAKEKEASDKLAYLRFQIEELEAAGIEAEEEHKLEQELNLLQNSEQVREALGQATEVLYNQELSLYEQLSEVLEPLAKLANVNLQISETTARLQEMREQMKEEAFALQELLESVESDPERLSFIEERLAVYHKLKLKYGLNSGEALMAEFEKLKAELNQYGSLEDRIAELESKFAEQQKEIVIDGLAIEEKRLAAKPRLEDKIHTLLREVGFEKAVFSVIVERNTVAESAWELEGAPIKPIASGLNKVYFEMKTNPGMPAGPLSQIASGGEISRVMLAIKSALAEKSEFPVLIFDEIDTGISGEIANKVGTVMQGLADQFQILAITHLPQIAAKGHKHYQIFKRVANDQTTSDVVGLDHEARILELAKMLSGETPTESALRNAAELIG